MYVYLLAVAWQHQNFKNPYLEAEGVEEGG